MIQPIAIKLVDRDEDLNFYTRLTPVLVTVVDFNRNQNRTINNVIVFTQNINEDNIVVGQI